MEIQSVQVSRSHHDTTQWRFRFVLVIVGLLLSTLQTTTGMGQQSPHTPTPQQLKDWQNAKALLADLGTKTLQNHIFPRSPSSEGGLRFWVYPEDKFDESEAKFLGKIPNLKSMHLIDTYAREAISGFTPDNQIDDLVISSIISIDTIVKTFPNLKSLYCSSPSRGNESSLQQLSALPHLTRLSFSPGGGTEADVDAILKNLTGCKGLEIINTQGEFSSTGLQTLKNFPNLKTFWVSGPCKKGKLEGIAPALEATQLKSLRIKLSLRKHEEYLPIPNLGHLLHLEEVILFGFRGDDLSGLNGVTNMKSLQLSCDSRKGSGCRIPADLSTLASNDSIETFSFRGNTNALGLTRLNLPDLPRFPNLRGASFFVDEEEMGDDELQIRDEEMQVFAKLPRIEMIQLVRQHRLTNEGLRHLTGLKHLKSLALCDPAFNDDVVPVLIEIPSLEYLNVSNTKMTESGLKTLMEKLPNLQRIDAYNVVDLQRGNEINNELRRLREIR